MKPSAVDEIKKTWMRGAAVVDATGLGEGFALFRRHAQNAAKALAVDEAKQRERQEHQRKADIVAEQKLAFLRPGFWNVTASTVEPARG